VNFDKLWAWPKPVQKPHPPIYLGGHSPQVLQRVVDYCDGWLPIGGRAGELVESIKDLRRRAEQAGRDPKTVGVSIFGMPADEAAIQQYRAAGVERAAFGLPSAGRDKLLPLMDRYAEFVRKVS
jgi:alkanesulfonate monooxygenase SsuD/methylene tetrahydromethanopterin reductase-like flavin-dependent oxidoreductase (luciferase family)